MYVCVWIIWVLLFHLVLNFKKNAKEICSDFIVFAEQIVSKANWIEILFHFFLLCGARKSHSHDATNISNVLYHIKCILHVHIYDDLRQTNLNFLLLLPLLLLLLLLLKILNSYCYTSWGSFSFFVFDNLSCGGRDSISFFLYRPLSISCTVFFFWFCFVNTLLLLLLLSLSTFSQ